MITAIVTLLGGVRATVFAGLLALSLIALGSQTYQRSAAENALLTVQKTNAIDLAKAQADARAAEQKFNVAAADAAAQYEKGKTDAHTAADSLLVGLLNNNVSLQSRWKCPGASIVPKAPAGTRQPDAEADDRAESAVRIVGAADECDAQVTALQALVAADRSVQP